MTKKIIFVAGIHGVGKTYLCQRLKESMGVDHFSAGQLISEFKSEKLSSADKSVKNINNNQELLLKAIEKYIQPTRPTLLDGHCCLLNSDHGVERIPIETFIGIEPCSVIVLYDEISSVVEKISGRDGVSYDIKLLSCFQDEEIKYAREIAERLRVPYLKSSIDKGLDSVKYFIENLSIGVDKT